MCENTKKESKRRLVVKVEVVHSGGRRGRRGRNKLTAYPTDKL
jgi:hypothetical protein